MVKTNSEKCKIQLIDSNLKKRFVCFNTNNWFASIQTIGLLQYSLEYIKCLPIVVVLGFYVPPTAKVIQRRDLDLKSHPKDWRSPGANSLPLVYKAGGLTTTSRRLLIANCDNILLGASCSKHLQPDEVAMSSTH